MATLMLSDVLEQNCEKYRLKILAGQGGLHRSLRWLYFSEDIGNADFLRGGELMLLTGHSFKGSSDLLDFVGMLINRNACGVIIPLGRYIAQRDITPALLSLCEDNKFPLMTMPWEFHFTDLMHDLGRQIFAGTNAQNLLTYTFQALLKNPRLYSEEDEARLRSARIDPEGEFCAAVLSCQKTAAQVESAAVLQHMKSLIENHLNQWPETIFVFQYQQRVILVFHNASCKQIGTHMSNILRFCEQALPEYHFYCGIGSPFFGIASLRESFDRAGAALQCALYQRTNLGSFDTMGMFQLLYLCQDPDVFSRFTRVLEPLCEHDRQLGGQLVETLRLYLQFNGSVNLVSEAIFCHRNTTNYRIRKIKALLHSDLEDSSILFRLQIAYYILAFRDMFGKEKIPAQAVPAAARS